MGFLSGLGHFAGGVSKGIEAEASEHAKNVAADAAADEARQKHETYINDQGYNAAMAGIADPTGTVSNDWDPATAATKAVADYKAKLADDQKTHSLGGVIHRIAGAISRPQTQIMATTSGVTPPAAPGLGVAPPAPAATPTPGVGLISAPGAAAPDAGGAPAPAAPAPAASGTDTTTTVDPITLTAAKRQPTARDRAQYEAIVAAQFGKRDVAQKAFDRYKDLNIAEKLKALDLLPDDEWSEKVSAMTGQDVELKPSKENPKNSDVYVGGRMFHENTDAAGRRAIIVQQMSDDPTLGYKYGADADKALEDRAKDLVETRGLAARATLAEAQARQLREAGPVETATAKAKLDLLTQQADDLKFVGDVRNADRYPDKWYSATQRLSSDPQGQHDPAIWDAHTEIDAESGRPITTYTNKLTAIAAKAATHKANSPYRSVIGDAYGSGDDRYFVVKDPNTGNPVGHFSSFVAAESRAKRLYGNAPPAAESAAPAPAAATGGRTVARTPMSGPGVVATPQGPAARPVGILQPQP